MGSPDHELSLDDCFALLPKQEISAAVVRVTPDDFSSSFFFNMRWMYVSRALEKKTSWLVGLGRRGAKNVSDSK